MEMGIYQDGLQPIARQQTKCPTILIVAQHTQICIPAVAYLITSALMVVIMARPLVLLVVTRVKHMASMDSIYYTPTLINVSMIALLFQRTIQRIFQ